MGLTGDATRALPEWQAARSAYDEAFAAQRQFNPSYNKMFANELAAADQELAAQVAQVARQSGKSPADAAREVGIPSVDVRRIATLAMDLLK